LFLDAADALARRSVAEAAFSEASTALAQAVEELQRHGFEINDIAQLLEVDATELGSAATRRPTNRGV
jgi:hypothetical protein